MAENKEKTIIYPGRGDSAILFLHGLGGKLATAEFIFKYLNQKGFHVYCPVLLGHEGDFDHLHEFYPEHWIIQAREELTELVSKFKKIFLVGASFGGDLCLSLAAEHADKIKGLVLLETPVFFRFRFWLFLTVLQPIFEFFGIKRVSKSGVLYRKNYVSDDHSYEYVPVVTAGKIFDYLNRRTKKEVPKICAPIYVIQAEKSDLISKKSARFIYDNVKSRIKRVEYLPLDSHDLELFEEKNKILTMEKVYEFLSKI